MSAQVRVLHVDDEADFTEITAKYLHDEDDRFSVKTASSQSVAVDLIEHDDVDCIVSDYDMPNQNGIQFLETVRDISPELPFILFTGKGSEEVASEAISAGVTDYLQKERGTEQYAVLANRILNAVERSRAQQRLTTHLERMTDAFFALDTQWEFRYLNERATTILDRSRSELLDEVIWEVFPDVTGTQLESLFKESVAEQEARTLEFEYQALGSVFDVHVYPSETGLSVYFEDITESRDLREKYELVVRASTDAFFEWDPVSDEITRSGDYLRRFGYEPEDIGDVADWWRARIHPDDQERVIAESRRAAMDPEKMYDETYRFRRQDGSYGYLRSRGYGEYTEDGEPIRMIGAHMDVSDLKEREQELEQQNARLEAFTRVISHDLRNPLNVATGQLALYREDEEDSRLEKIANAHSRINDLIEDLLILAKEGEAVNAKESVELSTLVRKCWSNIDTVAAELQVDEEYRIVADKNRLQQLLENLIRNAVEHGGEGVMISVGQLENGFYVEDDGPGILQADIDAVLDPGYSTKKEGTGFGLPIVKRIVDAHGWDLAITGGTNGGARFEISV